MVHFNDVAAGRLSGTLSISIQLKDPIHVRVTKMKPKAIFKGAYESYNNFTMLK